MAQWNKIKARGKVDDRRGMTVATGGIGLVGLTIVLAVAYFGTGEQAVEVMHALEQTTPTTQQQAQPAEYQGEDAYEVFVSQVVGSGNVFWRDIARTQKSPYRAPTLVLFRGYTDSACGGASSAMGPHYCPLDETIYLDETFFDALRDQFGARGGDVAQAYVIAHEMGHHAQKRLGIMDQVRAKQAHVVGNANELSIKQELQADCFAGLWAHTLRDKNVFEKGEIIEAMDAAEAVGDDRIQKKTQGHVRPETWTHGSSKERKEWFTRGYETGDFSQCNTFDEGA